MEAADRIEKDQIEGRNAVTEALRAGRPIDKLFLASGEGDRNLSGASALSNATGASWMP